MRIHLKAKARKAVDANIPCPAAVGPERARNGLPGISISMSTGGPDGTEVEHLGVLRIGEMGDRDGLLMDIQPDVECARVFHG
jgi:hypothetical protein